jgi:hypothetical protein
MRAKLIAGNILALLFASFVSFLWIRDSVTEALSAEVQPMVERSVGLFDALHTAQGDRYVALVAARSTTEQARQVFENTNVSARAQAASEFAHAVAQALGANYPNSRPRPADLVVITDEQGKFLGRNLDARADAGRDLRAEFEAVGEALRSRQPVHDYLRYDGQKWFDVVSAPIVREGQAVGLLMVGYEIADSQAAEDKRRLGAEVGYLVREGDRFALQSLSFGTQTDKNAILAWANASSLASIFNSGGTQTAQTISISGHDWTIAARALPGLHNPTRPGAVRAGYIVLRDVTAERSPAAGMVAPILYLSLIALLFLVVFNVLITNSILQPIEQIEEGLLKIINGDQSHRIDLRHRELGGVVDRINQLVSTLTGEEESDESGRISRAPQRPGTSPGSSSGGEE